MRRGCHILLLAGLLALAVVPSATAEEEKEPAKATEPLWRACYRTVDWFHAAEVPDSEANLHKLVSEQRLEAWSRDWIRKALAQAPTIEACLAEAKWRRKLLLWYVPAVPGQHVILPHLTDRYMMTGPFADPAVAGLINRRFVAVKLPATAESFKGVGLAAPGFVQPGLLILEPDGSVLHRMERIATYQPAWWYALLRRIVREHGTLATPGSDLAVAAKRARDKPTHDNRLLHAWVLLANGEHEQARRLLTELLTTPIAEAAHLGLAKLAIRERDGDGAWQHLEQSHTRALLPISETLRARTRLHAGRHAECAQLLEWRHAVDGDRGMITQEAWYVLGLARWGLGREAAAREAWKKAVKDEPASPWAALADACLQAGTDGRAGECPLLRGMDSVRWYPQHFYPDDPDWKGGYPLRTEYPRKPEEVRDVVARAVSFLLEQQREDGSWPGFRWGGRYDPKSPPQYTLNVDVAIAAACAAALHRHYAVAPKKIEAALARADRYLFPNRILPDWDDEDRSAKVKRGDAICWVYADAYRLRYLCMRLHAWPDNQRFLARGLMKDWIREFRRFQTRHEGHFPHYVYRSTFSTAAITTCLFEATDHGLKVPKALFDDAGKALRTVQDGPGGLYGYNPDFPKVTRTRLGAAARQPLCEWVQWRCGAVKAEAIPRAIDVFLDAYPEALAPARKTNFHVPELGHTAGYYFWHDFHAACIAARDAGPKASDYMRRLLQLLCKTPEVDGTFIDAAHSYGKCHGTAMALQCIHLLTTPLPPR